MIAPGNHFDFGFAARSTTLRGEPVPLPRRGDKLQFIGQTGILYHSERSRGIGERGKAADSRERAPTHRMHLHPANAHSEKNNDTPYCWVT